MARTKQKLHLSKGATHARVQFEEAKHKRDLSGKFADKPGVETGAGGSGGSVAAPASSADWHAAAKTSQVGNDDIIKLHVATNPKKPGSMSAERFAHYQDGMTVGDFKKAGGRPDDLAYDRKKGYVTFHDSATYKKLSTAGASPVGEINTGTATGRLGAIKAAKELEAAPKSVAKPASEVTVPANPSGDPPPPPPKTPPAGQGGPPDASKAKPGTTPAPKAENVSTGTLAGVQAPASPAAPPLLPKGEQPTVKQPVKMPDNHRYTADELVPMPAEKMADEGDKGLKWEYEVEYIKYGGKSWGPGINSQEDFNKRYKAAPLTYLTDDEYNNLGYTSVNMSKLPTFKDVDKMIGHRRDPAAIRDRMLNGTTTPPIVLRKNGVLRLMAGQSRIFTGLATGYRVPVKVLDV
jgi:hypothetical protein